MKLVITVFTLLLLCSSTASAEQINLPKDAAGWTVFAPSVDSTLVYVSESGSDSGANACVGYLPSDPLIGTNPFNPSGAVKPCATVAQALTLTHNNMPDYILFKRGETFTGSISIMRGGRSSSQPSVIGSYGSAGPPPVIKVANGEDSYGFWIKYKKYIGVFGLDFYAYQRDPATADYLAVSSAGGFYISGSPDVLTDGILVEGCIFRMFYINHIAGYSNTDT